MQCESTSEDRRTFLRALQRILGLRDSEPPHAPAPSRREHLFCLLLGLAFIVIAFAYLEITQPYYFTQDDNFCEMLPVHLQACRAFFGGEFPEWNPYQFLGAPTTRLGIYGLTYPPLYIAYGVARFILANEYSTFEILAFMHLVMAFVFMYWAARQWEIGPFLAVAASNSYVLAGYTLIVGRSWGGILLTLTWLPLYIGAVAPLTRRRVTWKWTLAFGLMVGVSYHSGFVQLWVYALLFTAFAIGVLYLAGLIPLSNIMAGAAGCLLGFGIAAPLIYVQMTYSAGLARHVANEGMPFASLVAAVLPYPLVKVGHPLGWGNKYVEYLGQFYYSGTVFATVSLALMPVLLVCFWSRAVMARNIWIVCAAIALVLALGDKAGLWNLLIKVPWLGKFRNPWRFYVFFNLFAAMGGAIFLQRVFNSIKWHRICEVLTASIVLVLMAYSVIMAKAAFYIFADKPYPLPSPEMAPLTESATSQLPQRAAALMPMRRVPLRSRFPGYALSLEQNFASIYCVPVANGYDPLVWYHPFCKRYLFHLARGIKDRDAAYQAWGVRWKVLYGRSAGRLSRKDYEQLGDFKGASSNSLYLWPVQDSSPLAFPSARPAEAFPITFSGKGARVDVSRFPEGGTFVINILAWPDFKVMADRVPLPFHPDDWGRIVVEVPPGATTLEARYSPPWGKGFMIGGFGIAVALLFAAILPHFNGRPEAQERE